MRGQGSMPWPAGGGSGRAQSGGRAPPRPAPPDPPDPREPRAEATYVPRPRRGEPPSRRPPLSLLKRPPASKAGAEPTPAELRGRAQLLESVLGDFRVRGEVKNIHPGPV